MCIHPRAAWMVDHRYTVSDDHNPRRFGRISEGDKAGPKQNASGDHDPAGAGSCFPHTFKSVGQQPPVQAVHNCPSLAVESWHGARCLRIRSATMTADSTPGDDRIAFDNPSAEEEDTYASKAPP